jgi:pSer/pThr/pTyr-binding forkhead associated (FHA) protein
MERLVVVQGGQSFDVAGTEVLVGRGERDGEDPPAKIDVGRVPGLHGAPTVSRRHARLRQHGGRWYLLVEPNSTNPTLVDGHLVPKGTEVPIDDGSRIELGDVALQFQAPTNGPVPAETTVVSGDGQPEPVAPLPSVAPIPTPEPPAAPTTESWAARLPARPPALERFGQAELRRVNPFRGLMIDADTWADAHDYHRDVARLHLLSAHGWGIAQGLEVVKDPSATDVLVVRPGLAIDQAGRALLLPEEVRLVVAGHEGQRRYVVASYEEELTAPQFAWSDRAEQTRVIERCRIALERAPPQPPSVELARLEVQHPSLLQDAVDPINPGPDEIDLRFRPRVAVRPRPELGVAQLALPSDAAAEAVPGHRLGLRFLMREIGLTTPYRPRWLGLVRLGEELPPAGLLYFSGVEGFAADEGALEGLRRFLEAGGVLFADPCLGHASGQQFATAVRELARRLGPEPRPVQRWDELLTSRHVLTEARDLERAGGIVLSTSDHGCLWQGGRQDQAAPREAIRSALELGTNVAVFARQRQYPLDVLEVES